MAEIPNKMYRQEHDVLDVLIDERGLIQHVREYAMSAIV